MSPDLGASWLDLSKFGPIVSSLLRRPAEISADLIERNFGSMIGANLDRRCPQIWGQVWAARPVMLCAATYFSTYKFSHLASGTVFCDDATMARRWVKPIVHPNVTMDFT